jgi:hypothetical protein
LIFAIESARLKLGRQMPENALIQSFSESLKTFGTCPNPDNLGLQAPRKTDKNLVHLDNWQFIGLQKSCWHI